MSRLSEIPAPAEPLQRRYKTHAGPADASSPTLTPVTTVLAPRFTVGRDRSGRWIVQDREGLVGGLFKDETAALHFAAEECNHNAAEICRAQAGLILEFAPLASNSTNIH